MEVSKELIESLISTGLGAFLGAGLAMLTTSWHQRIIDKRALAKEMYNEWESIEFLKARNHADITLKKFQDSKKTLEELNKTLPLEDWLSISLVYHFFQRLSIYVSLKEIDIKYAKGLFKQYADHFMPLVKNFDSEKNKGWEYILTQSDNLKKDMP